MNKQIQHAYLCVEYIPFMCTPITYNLVISEELSDFLLRNIENAKKDSASFKTTSIERVSKEFYNKLHKHNPTRQHYIKLAKQDYSKSSK
jgi:hypothetical protein